jgi:REP element-mobilizing transposase RayT
MARKPRIEYEARYLIILSDYKNQYKYYLHAYALMDNHVHLIMETGKIPLSKIMQGINQKNEI